MSKQDLLIIDQAELREDAPDGVEFVGYYSDTGSALGHVAVYRASSELLKVVEEVTI